MNLNPNDLERLRKLSLQLQKTESQDSPALPSKNNSTKKNALHPIETEEVPDKLFKELIKASPDGNVPPHLVSRLKEIEEKYYKKNYSEKGLHKKLNIQEDKSFSLSPANKKSTGKQTDEDKLYIDFKRLLLEDEDLD